MRKIAVKWVDPWTGEFCAGFTAVFTKERAAAGWYSRQAKAFKKIARQWTGLREPVLKVSIIEGVK